MTLTSIIIESLQYVHDTILWNYIKLINIYFIVDDDYWNSFLYLNRQSIQTKLLETRLVT